MYEKQRCNKCEYLTVLNTDDVYAVCRKTGYQFKPFGIDTRLHYCSFFNEIQKANEFGITKKMIDEKIHCESRIILKDYGSGTVVEVNRNRVTLYTVFCDKAIGNNSLDLVQNHLLFLNRGAMFNDLKEILE